MSKTWVAVIAGTVGIGIGLGIAKLYARSQVTDAVHSAFGIFGLGGSKYEQTATSIVVPLVS